MSEDTFEARRTRITGMLRPDTVFVLPKEVEMGESNPKMKLGASPLVDLHSP
jgi:hypothetical protein